MIIFNQYNTKPDDKEGSGLLTLVLFFLTQMTVTLNTAAVPVELKPFLSLYLEVIFESPVLRNGGRFLKQYRETRGVCNCTY